MEEFKARLKETVDWCSPRFSMDSLGISLRSEALRPPINIVAENDPAKVRDAVLGVIVRRSQLLQEQASRVPTGLDHRGTYLRNGRLLAHFPGVSLSHGFSVSETGGFIDADEVPPWDTWVYLVEDFVICWVPGNLESAIQSAIACNAERSLCWLSEVAHDFVADVEREGLL